MHCTGCGQENDTGASLCKRCGAVIIGAEAKFMEGSDLFGLILGGSLLLPLVWWGRRFYDTIWSDRLEPFCGFDLVRTLLVAAVALVAVCLFVPARHYDKVLLRRIGFIALAASIAVAACCVVLSGFGAHVYFCERAWMGVLPAARGAIGCVHLLLGACVMLFKLQPRPAHAGVRVAAGSVVGLVGGGLPLAVLGFLFALGCIMLGIHIAHDAVSVSVPFIAAGFLIGAIPGSALGAWLVRRAVGQRGSFRRVLLGALLGSVVPLIGTVIGAVIGSGWRVKAKENL